VTTSTGPQPNRPSEPLTCSNLDCRQYLGTKQDGVTFAKHREREFVGVLLKARCNRCRTWTNFGA
jgi:hypothetical protein